VGPARPRLGLAVLKAPDPGVRVARAVWCCRYGGAVGFNPYRTRVKRKADIAIVVAAFVIIAVLLGWAFFA
jgi:hypothetical protein